MTQFNIRDFISFDDRGRAQCPCCLQEGKTGKNLSIVLSGEHQGAYKCFRGHTAKEIRAAIGATPAATIPPATIKPSKPPAKALVAPSKVKAATEKLLKQSTMAMQWLNQRGITRQMVEHYRLGIVRARCGDSTKASSFTHLPSISIPIPNADATAYFVKKRLAPWLLKPERPDGYKPWSQYGIPAMAFHTHKPSTARQTWLCEGEWDAILLGWAVKNSPLKDEIQVSCFTCGAGNISEAGRLELLGQIVTFYDLDKPGCEGALNLQKKYPRVVMRGTVPAPDGHKDGWDVSDALQSDFSVDDFAQAAKEAIAAEPAKTANPLRDRLVINDDMLKNAADFTDWLVDDLLTADELFLLAASPRAGKSLLALTLTQAVASGGKFLGRPVSQGAVIYIRCEDSDVKTKERELKQGWREGLPVYWMDKFKLSELPHLAQLVEELDVRLVVFDTLSRVRDANVSESSAEMSQLLEPLQEMCKSKRCCGILVHHTGKVSTDNAGTINVYDTIRGSSAIRATCRGTLILAADDKHYRLHVENGWGKHDLQVLLDANTLQWRLLGNWIAPNVDIDQKGRVLGFLAQVGRATIDQIAEGTGLPKRSLYEVLKRLQADEMLDKHGARKSAVYIKSSIQQIQQLNNVLNSSNPDREKNRTSIQQPSTCEGEGAKSDHLDKCEHDDDQVEGSPRPPTPGDSVDKTGETQSQQGISNSTAIQQQFNSDSEVWLYCSEIETAVKLEKRAAQRSQVYIPGRGSQWFANSTLSPTVNTSE